jgi:hypothetical protein
MYNQRHLAHLFHQQQLLHRLNHQYYLGLRRRLGFHN